MMSKLPKTTYELQNAMYELPKKEKNDTSTTEKQWSGLSKIVLELSKIVLNCQKLLLNCTKKSKYMEVQTAFFCNVDMM